MIPRLGIGWTCNTADDAAFAGALEEHMSACQDLVRTPLLDRWLKYMTPKNFTATWTRRIRQRLGLTPTSVLDWEWVIKGGSDAGAASSARMPQSRMQLL